MTITFRYLSIALVFALFCPEAAGAFEPPQYDITATVDAAASRITAQQTVRLTNNTAGEIGELYFHIYPNRRYTPQEQRFMRRFGGYFKVDPFPGGFPQEGLRVRTVTSAGLPLDHAVEGQDRTLLKVKLARPLNPGEAVEVTMAFEVDIPQAYSRLGWIGNTIKASRWYPQLSVLNDQGWNTHPFYPFHRPFFTEASDYRVALTVSQDQVVAHSGRLLRCDDNGDATKTLRIQTSHPIREFSWAMSPDYQTVSDTYQGVEIKSFYLPGAEQRARRALGNVKDLMAFYAGRFGPYPYDTFSIAPVPLGYGGEQMSNLIFIDNRVYRLPGILERYFDFLVSHEAGHQWFYNIVGIDEYAQMWLEEGVNSFFIMEYLEDKYGREADVVEYPEWFQGWEWTLPRLTFTRAREFRYRTLARQGFDDPIVRELSSFQEPSSIFAIAYGKGSGVVKMLKACLREETFARVWKRIFSEYRFKNLDVKDLQRICEEESGTDLSWFFDPWLYTAGKFDYGVRGVTGNTVTLQNRGDITMPVEVRVDLSDGRTRTFVWNGQKPQEEIVISDTAGITRVAVDPDGAMMDIDRTDNFWPRKVMIKPVPLYLGLYDIPVFLPDDSYNIVFGPETADSGIGLKASWQKPYDQIFYGGTNYEFGEQLHHSRVGYQLKNLFHSPTTLGWEVANTTDHDTGEDDLVSGRIFLRRELWPAAYGLADMNDHVSLYVIRNQNINDGADIISGREDSRNVDYSRRREAIAGIRLHLNRCGPYPDPKVGYQADTFFESAGHFLGATQFFHRAALDIASYYSVTPKTQLALRMKYGWGYPDDKNLYYLGGPDGLRGYERKSVRGANALLGSVEYRFPLKEEINAYAFDHIIGLEAVKGVVFFDLGQAWHDDWHDGHLKKNAGLGLRFTVNIGAMLEKIIVRADVAQAINESQEDPHFWFGINHAF